MKLSGSTRSPAIPNGVIRWHEGDIFQLELKASLFDQDKTPIEITEGMTFIAEFRNPRREVVKTFECEPDAEGVITLDFDEETTALFPWDNYKLKMIYLPPEDEEAQIRTTVGIYDVIVEE